MNITIEDIGVYFADSGPWRSYALEASGNTLDELMDDAQIFETDQDGGSLNHYNLGDADDGVYQAAVEILEKEFKKHKSELSEADMWRHLDSFEKIERTLKK